MSTVLPWTEDVTVLFAQGAWTDFIPKAGQSHAARLNATARLLAYLTAGAYFMRRDPRFLVYGAAAQVANIAVNVKGTRVQPPLKDQILERKAELDEKKANQMKTAVDRTRLNFVNKSVTNPRESKARRPVVPTKEQEIRGGRPVLADPFGEFAPLFDNQASGPLKHVSGRKF
jgi:hypothetical protein